MMARGEELERTVNGTGRRFSRQEKEVPGFSGAASLPLVKVAMTTARECSMSEAEY